MVLRGILQSLCYCVSYYKCENTQAVHKVTALAAFCISEHICHHSSVETDLPALDSPERSHLKAESSRAQSNPYKLWKSGILIN